MKNDRDAMIPLDAEFYEISAEWMKACGKGEKTKVFPIKRVCGRLPSGAIVIELIDGERTWTAIHPWRGKVFKPVDTACSSS